MPANQATHRKKNRLPKWRRLRRQRDFAALFDGRCAAANHRMVVYAGPNGLDRSRMAVSVSRRLGEAVVRNRIKRRIREAFRLEQHEAPAGYDYLLIAKPGGPHTLAEYRSAVRDLCRRAAKSAARRADGRALNSVRRE